MIELSDRIANLTPAKRELLACQLRKKEVAALRSGSIPRRRDPLSPAPLSFTQQRLWFLDQLDPGSFLYNVPINIRLTGRLERGLLQSILNEIIKRHETLRTTFQKLEQDPV